VFGTESPTSINIGTTQPSSKFLIPVYVLASIVAIGLCVIVGFAVVCKIKITKQQIDGTSADLQRDSDVNREYYDEIVDTIYETISDNFLGMQVKMTNNDAYTENIQFRSSTEINVTNNDPYYVTNVAPIKPNSSYQAGHLQHFPKLNVAIDPYHSDGTEKQGTFIDGTELENPCTSTTTEYSQVTAPVQKEGSYQ
jgi:hypothetical protein